MEKKRVYRIVADNMESIQWYIEYEIKEQVQLRVMSFNFNWVVKVLAQFEI